MVATYADAVKSIDAARRRQDRLFAMIDLSEFLDEYTGNEETTITLEGLFCALITRPLAKNVVAGYIVSKFNGTELWNSPLALQARWFCEDRHYRLTGEHTPAYSELLAEPRSWTTYRN